MSLYPVGSTVYANRELITEACGDHPALGHVSYGDKLFVLEYRPGREHPYLLSRSEDGGLPFSAKATELMSQKPFSHNEYGRFGYT